MPQWMERLIQFSPSDRAHQMPRGQDFVDPLIDIAGRKITCAECGGHRDAMGNEL